MLLQRDQSLVLLIDVQEKLTPLVHEHRRLIRHCEWLLTIASELQVPIFISEQYPEGLRPTIPELVKFKTDTNTMTKVSFSCCADPACSKLIETQNRTQIVLLGIETHVCVLETALGLKSEGYEVFLVVDAVSSRYEIDHEIALKRMMQNNIELITREMAVFEWLHQAGTDEFRKISKNYLK